MANTNSINFPGSPIGQDWTLIDKEALNNDNLPAQEALSKGYVQKAADYMEEAVDNKANQIVQEIAQKASDAVTQQVHDYLYRSPKYYSLDAENQEVPIYTYESQFVDNLFEKATDKSLTAHIESLPTGVSFAAKKFRKKQEDKLVTHVVNKVSDFAVENSVKRALSKAYNYGKSKLKQYLIPTKNVAQSTQATIAKPIETKENHPTTKKTDEGTNITLKDMRINYENQIIDHLNDKIREIAIDAITNSAQKLSQENTQKMIDKLQTMLYTSSVLSAYLPAASLTSAGLGLLLGQYKESIANQCGNLSSKFANKAAKINLPVEFIARKPERTRDKHIIEIPTPGDTSMEFVYLDTPATFTNWAKQKSNSTKKAATDFCKTVDDFCGLMCDYADDEVYEEYLKPKTTQNNNSGLLNWLWNSKPNTANTCEKESQPTSAKKSWRPW